MEKDLFVENYRTFKRLIKLQFPSSEKIYLLYYENSSCLLHIGTNDDHTLVDTRTGKIIQGEKLDVLIRKVNALARLTGDKLEMEKIRSFLRIPEISFLLGEIVIDDDVLKKQLEERLNDHFEEEIFRNYLHPLYLDQYIENVDYIFNYMLTNLGSPERTENYFNKLRLMLTQILENTEFNRINDYFPLLKSLVTATYNRREDFVIVKGKNCYCIIKSKLTDIAELEGFYHHTKLSVKVELRPDVYTIEIDNTFLSELLSVFKNN